MTGQKPDSELIGDKQQARLPPNTDGVCASCHIFYSFTQKTLSGFMCSLQLCRIPLLFPVLFRRSVVLKAPVWQHSFVSPVLMLSPLMCCMCAVNCRHLPLYRVTLFHLFPFLFPPVMFTAFKCCFLCLFWTCNCLEMPLSLMNLLLLLVLKYELWASHVFNKLLNLSPWDRILVLNSWQTWDFHCEVKET